MDFAKATGLKAGEILQLLTRRKKLDFETLEDIITALGISIQARMVITSPCYLSALTPKEVWEKL